MNETENTRLRLSTLMISSIAGIEYIGIYEEVDSTMDVAFEAAQIGKPLPLVIFSEVQSKGRGRDGRLWESKRGMGIYATIAIPILDVKDEIPISGILTGLAIVRTLESLFHKLKGKVKLKWPNDIYINGKKAAGILVEKKGEILLVGYGLNVFHARSDLPSSNYYETASLFTEDVVVNDRNDLATAITTNIIELLSEGLFEDYAHLWREYDFLYGLDISVSMGNLVIRGVAQGISSNGTLQIRTNDGIVEIVSGDIVVNS